MRCTPITGSPQLNTMSIVMSKSWDEMRFAQVGKSGEVRTVTSMPTFLSWGLRYSAMAFCCSGRAGR